MTVIAFTSEIDLDVRCSKCRELGDGEKRILTIIRLAQEQRFDALDQYLGGWLRGSGQRFVAETAEVLGAGLARKGLKLLQSKCRKLCNKGRKVIKKGQKIPNETLVNFVDGEVAQQSTHEIKGKNAVIFALPGAYTDL